DNTPHNRSRSLQPKRPALKMTKGAERALPMSTKGFQTPSLRRRAQGNHGASGLVPPPTGRALSGTCALGCRVGTASAKKRSSRDLTFQSCARIDDVYPFGNRTSAPRV